MLDYDAAETLRRQLQELPELLAYAHLALEPGSSPASSRVSGATRTPPLPCRLDVLSALGPGAEHVTDSSGDQDGQTPIIGTLHSWARIVEAEHPCSTRPGNEHTCRPAQATIGGLLAYLGAADILPWTIGQPWADEYAAEIAAVHRTATRYAASASIRRPVRMVCPSCQMLTMTERPDGLRECGNHDCWAILSGDEYANRAERTIRNLSEAA